ncbi:MAG TPA: hypothetical protein VLG71_02000 [Candidatus Limnocylindria bacterium]|nr:hypothetical protein [Candidatus Limnocylindria bacterium]
MRKFLLSLLLLLCSYNATQTTTKLIFINVPTCSQVVSASALLSSIIFGGYYVMDGLTKEPTPDEKKEEYDNRRQASFKKGTVSLLLACIISACRGREISSLDGFIVSTTLEAFLK